VLRSATLVALLVLLHTGRALAQSDAEEAQRHMTAGVRAYDEQHFDVALGELRQSLANVSSPNTRLWVARTLRQLGRTPEALSEYRRTIRESLDRADPRYEQTRETASAELMTLEPAVGQLQLEPPRVPHGARVIVAGRELSEDDAIVPIAVTPGSVPIAIRAADGHAIYEATLSIASGERQRVRWRGETVETSTGHPLTAVSWLTVGIGATALAASGVFALMAQGEFDELRMVCLPPVANGCTPDRLSLGRSLEVATNAALIGGGAVLALGVVLVVIDRVTAGRSHAIARHIDARGLTIVF
jgi:hypothetical protein